MCETTQRTQQAQELEEVKRNLRESFANLAKAEKQISLWGLAVIGTLIFSNGIGGLKALKEQEELGLAIVIFSFVVSVFLFLNISFQYDNRVDHTMYWFRKYNTFRDDAQTKDLVKTIWKKHVWIFISSILGLPLLFIGLFIFATDNDKQFINFTRFTFGTAFLGVIACYIKILFKNESVMLRGLRALSIILFVIFSLLFMCWRNALAAAIILPILLILFIVSQYRLCRLSKQRTKVASPRVTLDSEHHSPEATLHLTYSAPDTEKQACGVQTYVEHRTFVKKIGKLFGASEKNTYFCIVLSLSRHSSDIAQTQEIRLIEEMNRQNMSKARKRKFFLKLSDFLLDLAKLIFGGIILTGIIDMQLNKVLLFITGSTVALILSLWGFVLFNRGTKTN